MVEGIADLNRRLKVHLPKRIRDAAARAMEQGAEELVAMMKRQVPVDRGTLRDSIGWTWGNAPAGSITIGKVGGREYSTMRITIYAGNEQTMVGARKQFQLARLQEFGTQAMQANPFFFASYRVMKKRIRSRVTREISKAIKSEAGQ